ncbi:MAG: hypothetical protein UW27_C0004G0041 [Parcubacteria group bacterium GW2011_GWA1_44_13]|uniref:Uncharacterized protein n=1 Tax=Candidatus Nomurabacteria bacterium GW2011_GWB1_44_12 TaxID=1618748 RepID=A0A837I778_9BACT|nr:MAG: hypothetical protein UW25_C0005G0041 [Candidatus Nomurabacteria bacterium GW2011_GWB1_44_12]KKT38186.1 MAG: hypothetical protein UW27_C0004G0041 [Parcubacteria group bacterium GW2011_GWA1_44_13]KKT59582.1 MAG: hypothetical protein UW54_C0023G0014 [Parcubacteria group bacterium GW2011_GWC1_44_26]HBB44253.1 hypothetical protein [Candidatus Yonathbacteria bacterium]
MKSNFLLETVVAEKLYEELFPALPDVSSRRKADTAQVVINTLARMSIRDLADFNNAMVDYISLPKQSKEAVLQRLCVKITELKVG